MESSKEIESKIIDELEKEQLNKILNCYKKSASMEVYAIIPFIVYGILFLVHNVFLAGNSYSYDTYNAIKNIELIIVAVNFLIIVVLAVMAMNLNSNIKSELLEICDRKKVEKEDLELEFNALATTIYGGRGVKLT